MSKTALVDALKHFDLDRYGILQKRPELKELRLDKGVNILQFSCGRFAGDDPAAASRQWRLAKWLVGEGFNPRENYTTAPGEDGEADSARVSLACMPGKDRWTVREIAARKKDRRYVSALSPHGVDARP